VPEESCSAKAEPTQLNLERPLSQSIQIPAEKDDEPVKKISKPSQFHERGLKMLNRYAVKSS